MAIELKKIFYKLVAENRVLIQSKLVPVSTSGDFDVFLDRPVSARYENFCVFLDGKFLSPESYERFDKNDVEIVYGSEQVTGNYPFIEYIRLNFSPATSSDQYLSIVYNVFSGDWIDYKELEKYMKDFLDLLVTTGNFSDELKDFLKGYIDTKVGQEIADADISGQVATAVSDEDISGQVASAVVAEDISGQVSTAVSSAISTANIPGLVSTAVSGEDISGQVSTAVSSAISTANIPNIVDDAVDAAALVLQGDLEDYIDTYISTNTPARTDEVVLKFTDTETSVGYFIPSWATKLAIIAKYANDTVTDETIKLNSTQFANVSVSADPANPTNVSVGKNLPVELAVADISPATQYNVHLRFSA